MPNATCKKNNSKNIDSLCDKQLKYFFSFKTVENQQQKNYSRSKSFNRSIE